ncbi:hypothetical protein [Streptomyces sp. NPDC015350]|uniref:hypothetical protein n=1 Tax=Streptomyces sp. NPDC015350 TaxID=3364955 RepID=UPI0036F918F9
MGLSRGRIILTQRLGLLVGQGVQGCFVDARRWDSKYGGGNWKANSVTDCLDHRAGPLLQGSFSVDDAPLRPGVPQDVAAGEVEVGGLRLLRREGFQQVECLVEDREVGAVKVTVERASSAAVVDTPAIGAAPVSTLAAPAPHTAAEKADEPPVTAVTPPAAPASVLNSTP